MSNTLQLPLHKRMENVLDQIMASVENREACSHASAKIFESSQQTITGRDSPTNRLKSTFGGPLTLQELCKLSLMCVDFSKKKKSSNTSPNAKDGKMAIEVTATKESSWGAIDVDTLMTLCPMLISHVESASNIDLIGDAIRFMHDYDDDGGRDSTQAIVNSWMQHPNQGHHHLSILRSGLEASCILLSIINTPRIDRRLIIEDGILACVSLLKQHLGKSIVMAMSNTGHLQSNGNTFDSESPEKRKRKRGDSFSKTTPQDQRRNRRAEKSTNDLVKPLQNVYKHLLSTIGNVYILMERMELLIHLIQLDDQPALALASTALSTFTINPQKATNTSRSHGIQASALSLIFGIFQRYVNHRGVIIEDLFPLMLKIPKSKKMMRTFQVCSSMTLHSSYSHAVVDQRYFENNNTIQPIVALILSLIQGCVTMPMELGENKTAVNGRQKVKKGNQNSAFSNGLSDCNKVCNFFTVQLLRRCSRKGEEGGASEFRPVLASLIDDLLLLYLLPEYPAADMLLFSISRHLSNDLLTCSKIGPNSLEATYAATALDALGKICAGSAGCLLAAKKSPLNIPKEEKNDDSESNAHDPLGKIDRHNCFCGRTNLVHTFMLDCDRCHAWFHGSCVDVTKDNLPKTWICDDCKIQLLLVEHKKRFAKLFSRKSNSAKTTKNEGVINADHLDEICVYQQLLITHFSSLDSLKFTKHTQTAREVHLAKWIQDNANQDENENTENSIDNKLRSKFLCRYFLEQWEFILQNPGHLTSDGNSKLMLSLAANTYDLPRSFPQLLGVLVKLMEDKLVPIRKLAVKAISQVVSIDPNIMMQKSVREAVARRFADESISVREAAVSLVGSFVLQVPLVAETFHFPILARLNDKGVSVRKRAVRIFRDVLSSCPSYRGLISACSKLLQLAANPKEDESVRNLIHETFVELWFSEKPSTKEIRNNVDMKNTNQSKCTVAETQNSSVSPTSIQESNAASTIYQDVARVSPCENDNSSINVQTKRENEKKNKKKDEYLSRLRKSAGQMIDVVVSSGSTEFLIILVKDLLFSSHAKKGRKAKESAKKIIFATSHCHDLVDAMMETLLEYEEGRSCASFSNQDKRESDDEGKRLVAIISTLGAFCEASPDLLIKHLDVFLPYLKADNALSKEKESIVVYSICKIITLVAPLLNKVNIQRLNEGEVSKDIENVTYKFGSVTLGSAISALANLANCMGVGIKCSAREKIIKIGSTFYGYLFRTKDLSQDLSKVKPSLRNNIHRALSVLGAICRHFHMPLIGVDEDFDDNTLASDPTLCEFFDPSILSEQNLFNASFACITFYLQKNDSETKCCALRALTGIFIARPRVILFVEQAGTIKELLTEKTSDQVQHEALQCWKEILLAEEYRIESGVAKDQMESQEDITVSKRISGDQDSDSSIAGGVMTQHCTQLFQLTKSHAPTVRYAATDLIGHLLRQGLINPMETVPHLFALQGDVGAPDVRLLARKLLIFEGEKRPDMLRQRVCAGVRQAYLFQRAVYPKSKRATAVVKEYSALGHKKNGKKDVVCIFGPIFEESIKSSRVQRQGLIKSLLSLFSFDQNTFAAYKNKNQNTKDDKSTSKDIGTKTVGYNHNKKKNAHDDTDEQRAPYEQLSLLSYAAQILAHLPYSASTDPLFIIHHISGIVAIQGAELLDRFRHFLLPFHLANSEEDDIDHSMVDELECSVNKRSQHWKTSLSVMKDKSFDILFFFHLCSEASALIILMRLKKFLKTTYFLTDTRCMEYSPNEKETIRDRSLSRPEEMPLFNCEISGMSSPTFDSDSFDKTDKESKFDIHALVKQYAEFRQLMREGNVSTRDESKSEDSENECENIAVEENGYSDSHEETNHNDDTYMKRRSKRLRAR